MEPEGSLPHCQVPPTNFLNIHINIIRSMSGSSKWSISLRFPHQNGVCTSPLPIRVTWPAHLTLLYLINRIMLGEEYRSLTSSLCSFLHSPPISYLLGPNILLNTLFSNTISLRSALNVSDQVSHPCKTTGKIIILCILLFIFLDSKLEDKRSCTEWAPAFPDFSLLLISSWIELIIIIIIIIASKYFVNISGAICSAWRKTVCQT